ncbi:Tropinone reductase homolog At5g06060 [Linum grandiflorum]
MAESEAAGRRWSLKGMTALVTGGTKGIGYAIVEELALQGAAVHTCSRNEDELNRCLEDWKRKGFEKSVTGSVCDVSSGEEREKLVGVVSEVFAGKLNILKPTTEVTDEELSHVLETNFKSSYNLCQLVHPLLKNSGSGSIVFVSSVCGSTSVGYLSVYGATKGDIFHNSGSVVQALQREEFVEGVLNRTPLRRIAEPEDVSGVVAFLCMPAACYITGQIISVDGGFSANGFSL